MRTVVDIAITTDENYMQHGGVMLASLFAHHIGITFRVHLVTNAVNHVSFSKLRKLVTAAGHELHCLSIDTSRLQYLKLSAHATTAVYYRLLIPELLDKSIEKVLYLDCDLIVKDSLLPLWEMQLTDYAIAAVAEPHFQRHHSLGLSADAPYFNSGVMLINLPVWHRENISERALAFLEKNPDRIEFWDQDALNVVLQGIWLSLQPCWNQQSAHLKLLTTEGLTPDEWEGLESPAVIHYSSKHKPWHSWCNHPLKHEYYYYLKMTPWKSFKLKEQTWQHQAKQGIKKALNLISGIKKYELYN